MKIHLSRTIKTIVAAIVSVGLVLGAIMTASVPATALGTVQTAGVGTITGTTVAAWDVTIPQRSTVSAYDSAGNKVAQVDSDANGVFSFTGLANGTYRLKFSEYAEPGDENPAFRLYEFWFTASGAPSLTRAGGSDVVISNSTPDKPLGDIKMYYGGSFTADLRDNIGAAFGSFSSIKVDFFDATTGSLVSTRENQTVNGLGQLAVSAIPPGTYKIRFSDAVSNFSAEYYDNATDLSSARQVVIPARTSSELNVVSLGTVTLSRTHKISGYVGDTGHTALLPGIEVSLFDATSDGTTAVASTATDAGGYYEFPRLPNGSYKVFYHDPNTGAGKFADQWFGAQYSFVSASAVVIADDNASASLDLALETHLLGRVVDSYPSGIGGVIVEAYLPNATEPVKTVETNNFGEFNMAGLVPDTYTLKFNATHTIGNWVSKAYETAITITPGLSIGLESPVTLTAGATLTGKVKGKDGKKLAGVSVCAWEYTLQQSFCADTVTNGDFTIKGLPAGEYDLFFDTGALAASYVSRSLVNTVALTTGQNLPLGVIKLDVGAVITGKVTNAAGAAIAEATVYAVDAQGDEYGRASTDPATGTYKIKGIPAGTYRLKVTTTRSSGENYVSEWFKDSYTFADGKKVTVVAGQTAKNKNVVLDAGASITGTVADRLGQFASDINVYAYGVNNEITARATTDASGAYTLTGLLPGDYKVYAWGGTLEANFAKTWFGNVNTEADALSVTVTTKHVTPDVNISMISGGTISGVVKNDSYQTLEGIYVNVALASQPFDFVSSVMTDSLGQYSFPYLAPGEYVMYYQPTYLTVDSYDPAWFAGARLAETASHVNVFRENTTTVADMYLNAKLSSGMEQASIDKLGAKVGKQLTVTPGSTTTPTGMYFYYQWVQVVPAQWDSDDPYVRPFERYIVIPGATNSTYTPTANDLGKKLNVFVTGSLDGYTGDSVMAYQSTDPVGKGTLTGVKPTIYGTPYAVGFGLIADPGAASWTAGTSFSYVWKRVKPGKRDVTVATTQSYTPVLADKGAKLIVEVTGTQDGYTSLTKTSAKVGPVVNGFG